MDDKEPQSTELQPGEAMIVIDHDLKARLVARPGGDESEPVSTTILWATALTMAINDEDDDVIRQLVERLMEDREQADERDSA